MRFRTQIYTVFALLVALPIFTMTLAQQPADSGPVVEAIKKRVLEFYALMQRNEVKQAEAYVSRHSLDSFRQLTNNPFVSADVSSVRLAGDAKSAEVGVDIHFVHPRMGSDVVFPRKLNWILEEGEWRLSLDTLAMFRPPEKVLPGALKFSQDRFSFGKLRQGEKKQTQVSFVNSSEKDVQVTEVITGCDCLKATTDKQKYAPGEKGQLTVEFAPEKQLYHYAQTIVVKTAPGDLNSNFNVVAVVNPRRDAGAKEPAAPRTSNSRRPAAAQQPAAPPATAPATSTN
jgi:hypothetical protein